MKTVSSCQILCSFNQEMSVFVKWFFPGDHSSSEQDSVVVAWSVCHKGCVLGCLSTSAFSSSVVSRAVWTFLTLNERVSISVHCCIRSAAVKVTALTTLPAAGSTVVHSGAHYAVLLFERHRKQPCLFHERQCHASPLAGSESKHSSER